MCRCKKCSFEFSSGKKKEKKAAQPKSGDKRSSWAKSEKKILGRRESDDAGGSMPKTTSEEKLASPEEGISAFDAVDLDEDAMESGVVRTLFQENINKDN